MAYASGVEFVPYQLIEPNISVSAVAVKADLIDKFIDENKKNFYPGELHLIDKLKK